MIKTSQLETYHRRVEKLVASHHLSAAFSELDSMSAAASAPWEIRNTIDKLRESYRYLRRYALDGVTDPQRDEMLRGIGAGILKQSAAIIRGSKVDESPTLYFGNVRYERLQSDSNIPELVRKYREADGRVAMSMFSHQGDANNKHVEEHSRLLDRLFNLIWVSYPLSADDVEALIKLLTDDNIRIELREQLAGAVMLGALEYYDERRLIILAKLYLSRENGIELRALVLLLICLWMQRGALGGKQLIDVMGAVKELSGWREDLKMVFLNLVKTRDTARITRTMNEEVIPGMLKLRPEILKKFKDHNSLEDMNPEDMNPEWEELLAKSGVGEKLKELNDLQTEGGDVMLGTFSGLKGFPFFHKVSNWFAPFYTDQPDVAKVLDESAADLGELIGMAPMICDNDKFSMVFSLGEIPSANRRMMLEQFKMQSVNLAELRNSKLNPELSDRNEQANRYIHDLYRFFTLFRRKMEFKNPFSSPINLAAIDLLADDFADAIALEAVGEFYFKRGYYSEAMDVFTLLFNSRKNDPQLMQKVGFCAQQSGEIADALDFYLKSELIKPNSLWTHRRIAQCYKLLGDHVKALEYYHKVAAAKPNDIGVALNMGHCYLTLENYSEALKCYYKVEYLDEGSRKALRPLAWCNFVTGDYERAHHYYAQVLDDEPTATDFLNVGHLRMAKKDFAGAALMYRNYMEAKGGNLEKLISAIASDKKYLSKAGVDPVMLDLVTDAAAYPEI